MSRTDRDHLNSRRGEQAATRVFIGAVIVAAAAGCLTFAAGVPAFSSADEAAHVDYAFQVWHGQLPVFEHGLLMHTGVGIRPSVQWVAQHPPLFYMLLAPVVGPLVDANHQVAAAMAARLITILIAAATVLAFVWAAKQIMPRRCSRARFAAPIILVCSPWFLRLGGAVYNDILLVLVCTVLFGVTARMIRRPEGRLDFVWLSLVLACGALTRFSFVPLALACLGALAVAQVMRARGDIRAWVQIIVVPVATALAASGWFYLRNLRLTGSIVGVHADWAAQHLGSVHRSVGDVIRFSSFWQSLLRQFAYSPAIGDGANGLLFVVPAAGGVALAALFVVWQMRAGPQRAAVVNVLILGLVLTCVVGIVAEQVLFVGAGGDTNSRYFAVLLPLLSLMIAVALTAVKPLGPWLLGAWLAIHGVDLFLDLQAVFARKLNGSAAVYPIAAWAGFVIHVTALGVALVAYVVWNRHRARRRNSDLTRR